MHKGRFITFEGGEGAGKSTLIAKVYEDLASRFPKVVQTKAPGGSNVGVKIRELVLHKKEYHLSPRTELLLFLADRSQHVEEVIRPALAEQSIVLCDRFNDSTVAYQGGARGFGEGLVADFCEFASGRLEPDLTIYLDIAPEIGLERVKTSRGAKDRIEEEEIAFHEKIRSSFLEIAMQEPKRIRVVDANRDREEVFKDAMVAINALF